MKARGKTWINATKFFNSLQKSEKKIYGNCLKLVFTFKSYSSVYYLDRSTCQGFDVNLCIGLGFYHLFL